MIYSFKTRQVVDQFTKTVLILYISGDLELSMFSIFHSEYIFNIPNFELGMVLGAPKYMN
jgi:hypothetical protein